MTRRNRLKQITGLFMAALLAIPAGVPGADSAVSGVESVTDRSAFSEDAVCRGLIEELLAAGEYEEGEAIAVICGGADAVSAEHAVVLGELERDDILPSLAGETENGDPYADEVSRRLASTEEDVFQVVLLDGSGSSTEELLQELYADPRVIMAEPNYLAEGTMAESWAESAAELPSGSVSTEQTVTGDLSFMQWYADSSVSESYATPAAPLHTGYAVNAPGWNGSEENAGGTVCIMDTGLDTTHPDLADVLYTFSEEQQKQYGCGPHGINVNTRQDIEEGTPVDEETYARDVSDHFMHGTHIGGIIAGTWNGMGVSGLADGARIFAVRLCADDGMQQGASDIVKGFSWLARVARDVNLKAVNVSLGSMKPQLIYTALTNRLGQLGVNVVYASGNSSDNLDETIDMGGENNSPYVITVNAADMDGKKTVFSNYGQMSTDLFAPGAQMLATVPEIIRKRRGDGTLISTSTRRRFFPETTGEEHFVSDGIERFDGDEVSVRFFDKCPVNSDGTLNTEAKEIGSVSEEAGFDDSRSLCLPGSAFSRTNPDTTDERTWMPDNYPAGQTVWMAVPVTDIDSARWLAVKTSLSGDSHLFGGITGVLCEKKEADGSSVPFAADMRFDAAVSGKELEGVPDVIGIGVGACMGLSGASWSELTLDLRCMIDEIRYIHALDPKKYEDISWNLYDPGEITGLYPFEDGGQTYLLAEIGIAETEGEEGQSLADTAELYLDNVAVGGDGADTGAYQSLNGTSMAAPCVAAALAIIAKDEAENASLTEEELEQAALERKAKLLASVDYDDDLAELCRTGGRLNLHGETAFTKKAPLTFTAKVMDGALQITGAFFGDGGKLLIDEKETEVTEWEDGLVSADVKDLPNGTHVAEIVNGDGAVSRILFSSSEDAHGRRLYEYTHPLPIADPVFMADEADGFTGMTAGEGSLYVMAVHGNEQAISLWRFDEAAETWHRCAELPEDLKERSMENGGLVYYREKVWCYTTRKGLDPVTPSLWIYDPGADSWERAEIEGLVPDAQMFVLDQGLFLVTNGTYSDSDGEDGESDASSAEAVEAESSAAEAAEPEAADSEASAEEALPKENSCFWQIDPEAGKVVPVSGTFPLMESLYLCKIAAGGNAMYIFGDTYDEEGESVNLLARFTYDAAANCFTEENLSAVLTSMGTFDKHNLAMAGLKNGAALICTSDSGQDTFILDNGRSEAEALEAVSSYRTAFSPIAAADGDRLYAAALNATEPDVVYMRSTVIGSVSE